MNIPLNELLAVCVLIGTCFALTGCITLIWDLHMDALFVGTLYATFSAGLLLAWRSPLFIGNSNRRAAYMLAIGLFLAFLAWLLLEGMYGLTSIN